MEIRFGTAIRRSAIVFVAAAMGFTGSASATLIDRGGGMIYDNVLDITWLQDANYGRSSPYTEAELNVVYNFGGLMTWANATAWASTLTYGGYSDWRLAATNLTSPTATYHDCSVGSAAACATSGNELGYMYYFNLDGTGDNTGSQTSGSVTLFDIKDTYWSSTQFNSFANPVYDFKVGDLFLETLTNDPFFTTLHNYAWAVRDGDVIAAAPEPASLLLIGLGALGLGSMRQRRRGVRVQSSLKPAP